MTDFEYFFAFYGLLLGLSVAEIASGLSNALGSRRHVKLGLLTPLLSLLVLVDITGFWMFAWAVRKHLVISWALMFGGLFVTVTYYLAASSVYPRRGADWASLDEHYWTQKKLVVGGVMLANLTVLAFTLCVIPPVLIDWLFVVWQAGYWMPWLLLFLSRKRAYDLVLIGCALLYNLVLATHFLPSSAWGAATGV